MVKFLLDTNAIIALLDSKNHKLVKRFDREVILGDSVGTSILNYYEYARGVSKSTGNPGRAMLKKYLKASIKLVYFDNLDVADLASDIYLSLSGKPKKSKNAGVVGGPDDVDILTASVALKMDAIIVTHDSDFSKITNLKTENWE